LLLVEAILYVLVSAVLTKPLRALQARRPQILALGAAVQRLLLHRARKALAALALAVQNVSAMLNFRSV
jgi:hypothetical protein